jgi:hypothetical protein
MEPITLILAALAAGAIAGIQATASQAIKDTYASLKKLIQFKFAGQQDAELALAKYEEKPEIWEAPLKNALAEVAADKDKEIVTVAQKVMALIDPEQAAMGKYNVQITGNVQGLVQGDNAQVTMTFNDNPPKK